MQTYRYKVTTMRHASADAVQKQNPIRERKGGGVVQGSSMDN